MNKILVLFVFFLISHSFASVESYRNSLFILLFDGTKKNNPYEKSGISDYIATHITNDIGNIYTHSIDVSSQSASDLSKILLNHNNESIYSKALENWFQNSSDELLLKWKNQCKDSCSLESLKKSRADILPLRYIIITEGVSGLIAREYIQGKDYVGDYSKILFFDTPHEGTGFADQALFQKSKNFSFKKPDIKALSAVLPLTLSAYVFGGVEAVQDVAISVAQNAVLGMAQNMYDISSSFSGTEFFNNYDINSNALWYLAQDASENDKKYENLISSSTANVGENIGQIQYLNATGMQTKYSNPSYSIVYSYGFPTIGNGRRTYEDFFEQTKNHIPKDKLKQVLLDSLNNVLFNAGINVNDVNESISQLTDELLKGSLSKEGWDIVNNLVEEYNSLGNFLNDSKLSSYIQGLSELRSFKINMDDLPSSALKILRILNEFIPEAYKSELYSAFMENFSPEIADVLSDVVKCSISENNSRSCLLKGLSVSAKNLSNYGLNFFDEGVFDVPMYSAYGLNVSVFKKANLSRIGYDIGDYIDGNDQLNHYRNLLIEVGKLETIRNNLDMSLRTGCKVLISPYDEICKSTAFAANVVLIADLSGKTAKLARNMKALEDTKHLSLEAAIKHSTEFTYDGLTNSTTFNYSDLEKMLFDAPRISIASVFNKGNSVDASDSIIPLILYGTCESDVYDIKSLMNENNCAVKENDIEGVNEDTEIVLYESSFAEKNAIRSLDAEKIISIKDVRYNYSPQKSITFDALNYWKWKPFTAKKYINEYRFIIDDLQPDSLRQIKIDFNAGFQIAYEREGKLWYVRLRIGGSEWSEPKEVTNPVRKDGLFVFRPKEIFDLKLDGKEHLLSSIQKEGPNMVHLYIVNKLGLSGSSEFTYLFESTPPLLESGWPKSFSVLSRVDKPYVYYNKQDFVPKFKDVEVSLLYFDGNNEEIGEVSGTYELVDSVRGTYKISADMENLWKTQGLKSGNYILEWSVGILDTQNKLITTKLQTMIYIDRDAPNLDLILNKTEISGKNISEKWGTIVNNDSVFDRSIRALRVFIQQENDSLILVKKLVESNEQYINFGWQEGIPNFEGPANLIVQAVDYAYSSEENEKLLSNSVNNGDFILWDEIVKKNTNENNNAPDNDFNVTQLESKILIDSTAPKILEKSFTFFVARKKMGEDYPIFDYSKAKEMLGINDTLKLSFGVKEPLLGRDSTIISARIKFNDEKQNIHKVYYLDTIVMVSDINIEFIEPTANRLKDGIYDVSVELIDNAGNKTDSLVYQGMVVDRVAPVITELMNGDVAFENISELKKSKGYISQVSDYDLNKTDLFCYARASSGNQNTDWFFVGKDSVSKSKNSDNSFEFSIVDKIQNLPNGLWTIRFGCFDGVGNYGEKVDFFGMGKRYPRITFPEEGMGDYFGGKVLIEGTTPNPIVKNGNDKNATFVVEWCKIDSSECSSENITYLTKTISEQPKPLAIWNAKGLLGDYKIRLKVSGCDYQGENCETAVNERVVSIVEGIESVNFGDDSADLPSLEVVEFPKNQIPAAERIVSLKLEGSDTSQWSMNVSLKVKSPNDSSLFVPAKNIFFSTVRTSPFYGEPTIKKEGLSVWQNGKKWNIYWKGNAESSIDEILPFISLKYQKESLNFDMLEFLPKEDTSVNMLAINEDQIKIPAYNAVRKWALDDEEIFIQFESDSAFVIDVSSVKNGSQKIFCGKNSVLAENVFTNIKNSPMLYVFPQEYLSVFSWNGLTQENLYPSGGEVQLQAYAYNKKDKTKLVFCEKSWYQAIEDFKIITSNQGMKEFYVGFSTGDSNEENSFTNSNFNYEFGIAGQSAYVSAEIYDSEGRLVKKLMENQFLLAGTSKNAYSVSWDGTSETGFVSTKEGKYTLKITAAREGSEKTLSHDFQLVLANKLIPAPREFANSEENPAELVIDEASIDEMGNLRYYGNPDYLLEADVTSVTLPKEQQKVTYQWTMNGTQYPIYFEKNRYSIGVHRHRKKFPVTVAVLLAGYGHDLSGWPTYAWEDRKYNIKLFWKRIVLEENSENEISEILLEPWNSIVGFDKDGNNGLRIGVSVKIFSGDAAKIIDDFFSDSQQNISNRDYIAHASFSDPEQKLDDDIYTWDLIWKEHYCVDNKDKCPNSRLLQLWWENFNGRLVPLWSTTKKTFYYDSGTFELENTSPELNCKPSNTIENISNKKFICNEDDDYNVHKDMVKISVSPTVSHNNYSYGNYSCWCDNDGSDTEIAIRLKIAVKEDYWYPQYGYNNLANTFTRLDPQNIALFNEEGYCNLQEKPCQIFDGENWVTNNATTGVTAFEVQKFSMAQVPENPLLFPDEYTGNSNEGLSNSTYSIKFYNAKDAPISFRAAMAWNENGVFKRSDLDSDNGVDSIETPSISNPLKISFYVAPKMSAKTAIKSNVSVSTTYPFTSSDFSEIENSVNKMCENCKFYHGLASGLHFSVGDWNLDDWNSKFLIDNNVIKNPLTATTNENPETTFTPVIELNSYIPEKDGLLSTYLYDVTENDSKELEYWQISKEEFLKTKPHVDKSIVSNGYIPSGDFELKISTPNWKPQKGDDGDWFATNEGTEKKSTASFIWSLQKPWDYNRSDLQHKVSLEDIKNQDLNDEILGKPWMKKIKISNPKVYVRGEEGENTTEDVERKLHPYYTAEYDSIAQEFNVIRNKNIDYTSREPEKITLRGRVPGENQKWNLFYIQNGKQNFLKSGIQNELPLETPYPVLDYVEMNRLQGNTSFFLTYGGINGETYFHQLDVHVGSLLKSGKGGVVESMYGEISVNFEPGTWGENDVDVTVRTISKAGEYNFEAFKNLDIIGPVIEVLPSHDFSKLSESQWPLIHVRLQCKELKGVHPSELKVYKPDFESKEIMPLETQNILAFDKKNNPIELNDLNFEDKCESIEIIAKTNSFSTFIILDEKIFEKIELVDSALTEKYELVCNEISLDTLWAGTVNGWLEYPYSCSGKSNYLIQLRKGEIVVAEHQAASTNPIKWNIRKSDISLMHDIYTSRINIYGIDGQTFQYRGPIVRIDSISPVIDDINVSVMETFDSRILQVDVSSIDEISGISKMRLDVYFGGNLVESRTILGNKSVAENFILNREMLYNCVGCKANVNVTIEDFGHNYAKATILSEKIYPYPTSLFLWYPLSEGVGNTAYEVTGNGPDIDISNLKHPWQNGKSLNLFASDRAMGKNDMSTSDSLTAFSVELRFSSGNLAGTVFGWEGENTWLIGVDANGKYYFEIDSERITFTAKAERNVKNHIVLTINDNYVCLYKNGIFVESKNLGYLLKFGKGGKPIIGRIGSAKSIVGGISDVRIYRTSLDSSQVFNLFRDGLDLSASDIVAARAIDLDRGGLLVEQSCAVSGKAYLRQKNAVEADFMTWNVDVTAGHYSLYLLSLDYVSKKSRIEIFVDGLSYGIYTIESTGLWKSSRINGLSLPLSSGENRISIRPVGSLGIAALALVNEAKNIPANLINYGEANWTNPTPRISVKMHYENQSDVSWVRPRFQLQNLTGMSFKDVRIRYYYSGEGESVQAMSFYPNVPMSVVPDAGDVYYGELLLTESIQAYGSVYYGNGPQIGLHRTDYYFPWNVVDDPSFAKDALNDYVEAKGIAVLDADGFILNDWNCYDSDGPLEKKRKSVRVLAKDSKTGSNQSSLITMLVENTGETAIEGYEVRYYYRDDGGMQVVDVYNNPFATSNKVSVGGDLYYVSFLYTNAILNPSEKSDFGNGVNFEIHNADWSIGYNSNDDPSHYNLNEVELIEADSAIVLDLNGNLLWGYAPQPTFKNEFIIKDSYENLIDIEGDVIYVHINEKGLYTLETVNAAGTPLVSLFKGMWGVGEHSISLKNHTFSPGCYLVLRRENEILSWKIFK